jgi:hypothetical protein
MSQEMMLIIIATVSAAALVILDYYNDKSLPYYGDGGQVKYVRFLLNTARPELFCKITGLKQETFDQLVLELCQAELLEDGRSVMVEKQVLMFLDIIQYNNLMRQVLVKF